MNTGFYIQQTNLECEGKSKISRNRLTRKSPARMFPELVVKECRNKVQNQVRHRINLVFQEEDIEMPFPQRDTHLDTSAGPWIFDW